MQNTTEIALPQALKELSAYRQWVLWRSIDNKQPIRARDGFPASVTNPSDWCSYSEAVTAAQKNSCGIGFVVTDSDPFTGIDLDTYKTTDAKLIADHEEIVRSFASYTEITPRGGRRVWVKGYAPPRHPDKLYVECYSTERYFTVTGNVALDLPIEARQELLDELIQAIDSSTARAPQGPSIADGPRTASNDEIVSTLFQAYPHLWNCDPSERCDRSAVDFQLCKEIARLTRNRQQTYEVFMQSPRAKAPRLDKTGQDQYKCLNRPKYVQETVIDAFADINWHAENLQRNGVKVPVIENVPLPQIPPSVAPVEVVTLSTIAAQPIEWLWEKWLPLGKLVLLAGAPGTGKSTLAFSMAAIASQGGKWPDRSQCVKPAHVMLWSSEDDPADTIVPRLTAMGANLENIHMLSKTDKLPFNPATDFDKLKSMIRRHGISLLIIDPIVSAVSGDMNKSNEVRKGLQSIVDFANEINCCVVGITHFAKGTTGRNPAERVIGSVAFGAFARMVLVAARDEESDDRVLVRAKSNISQDDGGFKYEIRPVTLDGSHIKTTSIQWREQIDGSSREILADVEHQENGKDGAQDKLSDAKTYLLEALASGPQSSKKLIDEAIQLGIASARTIIRAKKLLNIRAKKQGMEWIWMEPFQTTMPAQ